MTSKNNSQFLSNNNLSMLFEVIIEEYKNYILDKNAFNIAFNEMVQMFYYNQVKSGNQNAYDMVIMNKNFISFISVRLEKKFNIKKQIRPIPNTNNNPNTKNNPNTNNNANNLPITNEDIKNKRLENFDKELSLKQNEFKNAFNNNVPEMPNFKSPVDEPLNAIDILTKKKMEERENEIQSIYNNDVKSGIKNNNSEFAFEIKESNDWLQYFSEPVEKKETNIGNIMKSIKINEEIPKNVIVKDEIIMQENRKKNISWSDEERLRVNNNYIKIKILEDQNENKDNTKNKDIFSKLKKIEGGVEQTEIDVLTPAKVVSSGSVATLPDSYIETITRMENKIDKLSAEINKCYDVITLLFNTIMSSNNISSSNINVNNGPTVNEAHVNIANNT
jgi:hypothetical protein